MTDCSYAECNNSNWSTALYTVDTYGIRWFCDEHWEVICLLFNLVITKCMKTGKCRRNHKAEVNTNNTNITTVKFNGKFFDLCDKHNGIYEELLGINSLFGFD